jgi:hypothetical protein
LRALTVCRHSVSGSISLPSLGCFSPFPHGTCSLSVTEEYLGLEGGPPMFRQDFTCPALLEDTAKHYPYGAITRSGRPFQDRSGSLCCATGLVRVRSPLLTESRLMSFPPGTEMFQFPGFAFHALWIQARMTLAGRVSPFGNPRIKDCSHLPAAYRRVPRPSSPLSAKASTKCPSRRLLSPSRPQASPGSRNFASDTKTLTEDPA